MVNKTTTASPPGGPVTVRSDKNGQMTVPSQSVSPPTTVSGNPCPNRNWTPTLASTTLNSYDYTLTFEGFSSPYIESSQTDP